jgi:hypothetical protein
VGNGTSHRPVLGHCSVLERHWSSLKTTELARAYSANESWSALLKCRTKLCGTLQTSSALTIRRSLLLLLLQVRSLTARYKSCTGCFIRNSCNEIV